jgi:hypothetical protein
MKENDGGCCGVEGWSGGVDNAGRLIEGMNANAVTFFFF